MRFLILFFGVFSALPSVAKVGEYRGHREVQQVISERLLVVNSRISFLAYPGMQYSLLPLLGEYSSNGENRFVNGQPNAISLLVWQMALEGVAKDIGLGCGQASPLLFHPIFRSTLSTLCAWPSPEAQSESAMREFWLAIMGYDAPEEEFLAWRDFFLHSSYAGKPAAEALPALVFSILYNPHFLLRK